MYNLIEISFRVLETKSSFFQRQFNSAVKLLGNITCWQGTLADHVLKDLAINSLLNRYLLSGLRVCQVKKIYNTFILSSEKVEILKQI